MRLKNLKKKIESIEINEKIKILDKLIDESTETRNNFIDLAKKANEEGKLDLRKYYLVKIKEFNDKIDELIKKSESLQEILDEESEEETVEKPNITTVTYKKDEMDKYLNNKESIDLLNFYGLKLPSEYKGKSLEELQKLFKKGME